MSTQQEIPAELKESGAHRPGPGDPAVESDISSQHGTVLIVALIAIVIGIFFSALFANGLYRSSLRQMNEVHGNPSLGGAAIKARKAAAERAEQGGSIEDADGNVRELVPVSKGGELLLAAPDTLAGSSKHQVAKDGETADIPELPSYEAVLDPEAAAQAAAEDEENDEDADDADAEADEDGEADDAEDADAEAEEDGAENADDAEDGEETGDDGDSEEDAE